MQTGKSFEFASGLFHVGGLSGAGALLSEGHIYSALVCALAAALCVFLLSAAYALAEKIKHKSRRKRPQKRRPRKQVDNSA